MLITNITVEHSSVIDIEPLATLEVRATIDELKIITDSISENNPVFIATKGLFNDFTHQEIKKALMNTYPHKFI